MRLRDFPFSVGVEKEKAKLSHIISKGTKGGSLDSRNKAVGCFSVRHVCAAPTGMEEMPRQEVLCADHSIFWKLGPLGRLLEIALRKVLVGHNECNEKKERLEDIGNFK
ncbi:hypothetical protein KY290_025150 [Solanum tuberosum]|uniref:Uncharacterized protein n=1 Tax=Solanum tuberosum TaxID=4113 RepID=A0ABQ7UST0_SOLTU|nr:hypothetical protein KY290_025150 [Solanum tuberosum]